MKKSFLTVFVVVASLFLAYIALNMKVHAAEEATPQIFELPIEGSTGFASVRLDILEAPYDSTSVKGSLNAGTAFTIKGETMEYFFIDSIGQYGWVKKSLVMINLPDIIPSIIYYDTNSFRSMFRSSGVELLNITNEQLYDCFFYNHRFDEEQFVMPALYGMACKIMQAQQEALADGNSLMIYETYRPHDTQMAVSAELSSLMSTNSTVYAGIASWGKGWFIATGYSNHQRGRAMDVSLVKVTSTSIRATGGCEYLVVETYEEYEMPTAMHELSTAACTFQYGVNGSAWASAPLSRGMQNSEGAQLLQRYCTNAGLTPLASEWWHFDDNTCSGQCTGEFRLTTCLSETP